MAGATILNRDRLLNPKVTLDEIFDIYPIMSEELLSTSELTQRIERLRDKLQALGSFL